MNKNHVRIGTVVSKHGFKGFIKINILSFNLDTLPKLINLFIDIDNCLVPFMIEEIKSFSNNLLIIKFIEISSEKEVNLAQKKALSYGIDLLTYKASNVKQSAKIYDQLLADEKPQSLAIWLLQDRTIVDSKVVLPFILERSWQRSIMVFSSSLGHVKKGALFCMYPDNRAHGKQLAQIIDNYYQLPARVYKDPMPTKDLLMAINSRTAAHLGLDLNKSDLRKIDVVFPLTN